MAVQALDALKTSHTLPNLAVIIVVSILLPAETDGKGGGGGGGQGLAAESRKYVRFYKFSFSFETV